MGSVLVSESQESLFPLSALCHGRQSTARRGLAQIPNHAGTLNLDFSLQNCENYISVIYMPPNLYCCIFYSSPSGPRQCHPEKFSTMSSEKAGLNCLYGLTLLPGVRGGGGGTARTVSSPSWTTQYLRRPVWKRHKVTGNPLLPGGASLKAG